MTNENNDRRVATSDKAEKAMEFIPFGSEQKIKLTVSIVKNLLCTPTKSGRRCSDADALKFMMMCQARALNPFEGDAFLTGYDTREGDVFVPKFSLITAHQAFLKRAELHPQFEGMESGVILLVDEEKGETRDREGDFHLPGETVVGGWATVFKTGKKPTKRRVRMARFNKGFGVWRDDPAGMIVKCAEADALRSSFPTKLGGMYLADEMTLPINIESSVTELPMNRLVATTDQVEEAMPQQQEESASTETAEQSAAKTPGKPALDNLKANSAQDKLARFCAENQVTFDQFQQWALESENVAGADSMESFGSVPQADAERLMRAPKAMLHQIRGVKPAEKIEEKGK